MRPSVPASSHAQLGPERAFTHEVDDPAQRRERLCTCSICGETSRCLPTNDFYTLGPGPSLGKPLVCELCSYVIWSKR